MPMISPLAQIDKNAHIGSNVHISPYAIIEADTVIGDNCHIGPHTIVKKGVTLGRDCRLDEHVVLGGDPQDIKFDRRIKSGVVIGDGCVFREMATVHRATSENKNTVLGKGCYMMACSHYGHDCIVGDEVIATNNTLIGGHSEIGDKVIFSAISTVHQWSKIGRLSFIGAISCINRDVLPYSMIKGCPAKFYGINAVGLSRNGFAVEERLKISRFFKLCKKEGFDKIREAYPSYADGSIEKEIAKMIVESKRGLTL